MASKKKQLSTAPDDRQAIVAAIHLDRISDDPELREQFTSGLAGLVRGFDASAEIFRCSTSIAQSLEDFLASFIRLGSIERLETVALADDQEGSEQA